jgi:HTH-like domain
MTTRRPRGRTTPLGSRQFLPSAASFGAYGWRRVRAALRQRGVVANGRRIRRLMRAHGLQPGVRRHLATATDRDHDGPIFPDLAKDMAPNGRDQLWVAAAVLHGSSVLTQQAQP